MQYLQWLADRHPQPIVLVWNFFAKYGDIQFKNLCGNSALD
jgi:hypothetical protein